MTSDDSWPSRRCMTLTYHEKYRVETKYRSPSCERETSETGLFPFPTTRTTARDHHRGWRRDGHTNSSRRKSGFKLRLHVAEDITLPGSAVLDVDPNFFKVIEGRQVKERLNKRQYVDDVRQVLKARIRSGFMRDEMLRMDREEAAEEKCLEAACRVHAAHVNAFESFLDADYSSAMQLLKAAADATSLSKRGDVELNVLRSQVAAEQRSIYSLDEIWRSLKTYQRFLYRVSPVAWRHEHQITFSPQPTDNSMPSSASLDELIESFRVDVSLQEEPKLYFTDPSQLLKVFENMELQNLNSLLHSEDLSSPIQQMQHSLRQSAASFEKEANILSESIQDVKTAIEMEEVRATELEKITKNLLSGAFRSLIISKEALRLHVYVEDAYESCVASNDSNLDLCDMMKGIERKIERMFMQLDQLPYHIAHRAETECYGDEMRVMKEAEDAAVKLRRMEKLVNRLKRALHLPPQKAGKPLKQRSKPPLHQGKSRSSEKSLSERQQDFLDFFTEYCHHTDDINSFFSSK